MGSQPATTTQPVGTDPEFHEIAIIGAGFGGLGAAIKLREAGHDDIVILERREEVGGTWWDNTYPGCACDIPSRVYSLSFAQKPDWSTTYPRQPEILQYVREVVDRFDLGPTIRLNTNVDAARWDDETKLWRIETPGGAISSRILIAAPGLLAEPSLPDLKGLDTFEGHAFHSARWDHDYDLTGKRVAVVGTGASAVQFVPEIQPLCERLTVFQRTAPWVLPRPGRDVSEAEQKAMSRVPGLKWLARAARFLPQEAIGFMFYKRPGMLRALQVIGRTHIRRQISDPELRKKVTPNFQLGCKRILGSNAYYPALQEPNAELIDSGVAEVRGSTVIAADGSEREVDTIIFGTGFEVDELPVGTFIYGRDGRSIAEVWDGSPEAYRGTTVSGYPNMFMIVGPNVGLGHNSAIYMIESQLKYILGAVEHLSSTGTDAIEVTASAQAAYNERLQSLMKDTVWMTGCNSWYLNDEGRNHTLWPSSTFRFRQELRNFDSENYATV